MAGIGEELSHYRVVRDRNGELLWERSFYTKYFPRGDVWKVSPDMKGQAPIDPNAKFPPLPPAGIDSIGSGARRRRTTQPQRDGGAERRLDVTPAPKSGSRRRVGAARRGRAVG